MKFNPSHYYLYDEMHELIQSWESRYPDIVTAGSIGKSYQGRDIPLVTLSIGNERKPAALLTGNIHSAELMSSCATLYAINEFLERSADDEEIQQLLRDKIIYCIPRINVDAAEMNLRKDGFYRGSMLPFHEKEDGVRREDVDGDGGVRFMRRPNPNGDFYASPLDDNLMFRIWPGMPIPENAARYDYIPEGIYYGSSEPEFREARCEYDIDPNRSFPFEWDRNAIGITLRPCAGDYPLMDCETRALAQFVLAHPEIVVAVDTHTNMGSHLVPMEFCKHLESDARDSELLYGIGETLAAESGYQVRDIFPVEAVRPAPGSYVTWLYYHLGIPAWCSEIGSLKQLYTTKEEQAESGKSMMWMNELSEETDIVKHHQQLVKWDEENNEDRLFHPWKKFHHPQFGDVEIGGWCDSNDTNPIWNFPEKYVEKESRLQYNFYVGCIAAAADVKLRDFHVTDGHASAIIENIGQFPSTKTFHAHQNGACGTGTIQVTGVEGGKEHILVREQLPMLEGLQQLTLRWDLGEASYDQYQITIEGETAGMQSLTC